MEEFRIALQNILRCLAIEDSIRHTEWQPNYGNHSITSSLPLKKDLEKLLPDCFKKMKKITERRRDVKV